MICSRQASVSEGDESCAHELPPRGALAGPGRAVGQLTSDFEGGFATKTAGET